MKHKLNFETPNYLGKHTCSKINFKINKFIQLLK